MIHKFSIKKIPGIFFFVWTHIKGILWILWLYQCRIFFCAECSSWTFFHIGSIILFLFVLLDSYGIFVNHVSDLTERYVILEMLPNTEIPCKYLNQNLQFHPLNLSIAKKGKHLSFLWKLEQNACKTYTPSILFCIFYLSPVESEISIRCCHFAAVNRSTSSGKPCNLSFCVQNNVTLLTCL